MGHREAGWGGWKPSLACHSGPGCRGHPGGGCNAGGGSHLETHGISLGMSPGSSTLDGWALLGHSGSHGASLGSLCNDHTCRAWGLRADGTPRKHIDETHGLESSGEANKLPPDVQGWRLDSPSGGFLGLSATRVWCSLKVCPWVAREPLPVCSLEGCGAKGTLAVSVPRRARAPGPRKPAG